jgi:hypothetical protein
LSETQRQRLREALTLAIGPHAHLRQQSKRLTQGKKLRYGKVVNAYDLTLAPMVKGKSNGPAQCGRKPGSISEPATGFLFANRTPQGNPHDVSDVLPWLDQVAQATKRVQSGAKPSMHAVAGALALNDPVFRQALHARQILPVGMPKTVEPIDPNLSAEDVLHMLNEAD